MVPVISRRMRSSDLCVVVVLVVCVRCECGVCVSGCGVCMCMNRYSSCTLMRGVKKKRLGGQQVQESDGLLCGCWVLVTSYCSV